MAASAGPRIQYISQLPLKGRIRLWTQRHRDAILAWTILTPVLIYYFVFSAIPLIMDVAVSFLHWTGFIEKPTWAGISNYLVYFTPFYLQILFNTFLLAIVVLFLNTGVAFLGALLLNVKVAGRGVFRSLWYLPTLTNAAITASVMVVWLSPSDGVLNAILKAVGIPIVMWQFNPGWMRFFIVIYTLWRSVGSAVVLFLAALQSIHPELYEAAMVDGAGRWQLARHITWPLMRPMVTFVMVTGMIGAFQMFESVKLMTNGGPKNTTNVVMLQLYNDAFVNLRMGRAAAGSVITGLILVGFSITAMRMMARRRGDDYGG